MRLTPGDHLGPYEILSPLGAGGMGEVYRARDTKLNRDVAIKVLPAGLANDADYLARFQREAQALAALHHPNIATIFGLELNAIVMELIEGQNPKGPLPLNEALNIARQMAEALEAAHDKGIIHRDLKPGNVIVMPEGVVKVLDFGLAKTAEKSAGPTTADSPTLTMRATEAGLILGTAGYMSPEQAAGKPVDRRADIWSFGVVLHELLTGKRLFDGETVSHTLAHVLTADVDLSKVPAGPIRDLLRRCLDRNLKTRLRDIGEARIAIESYLAHPPTETKAPIQSSRWPWIAAAVFALAAIAMAALHSSEAKPVLPVVTTTLLAPEGAEYDFTAPYGMPALSPDGTRLVYAAKGKDGKTQLWLRRLDSAGAQPLANTENAATPFWSPDSQWIAFGQEKKLKKIDLQGAVPFTITDIPDALRGGSWNTAGVIVFGTSYSDPILQVAASGGKATPVTEHQKGPDVHRHPWFLPDGRHFLYNNGRVAGTTVLVGSLDEPDKPGKMVAESSGPAVYAQGYLLYLRDDTLMAQPFDATRLATTGEAVQLAEGIPTYTTSSRIGAFAASPGGLLVHQGGGAGRGKLLWKDRQGRVFETLGEIADEIRGVALSPDGKRAAVHLRKRADTEDLWIFEGGRGVPTRFTFGPKRNREEVWSPDGTMMYFTSDRKGNVQDIYRKASNGTGTEELLWSDGANNTANGVSPDGKWLLYTRNARPQDKTGNGEAGTRRDLMLLPLGQAGKAEPRVFLQTPFNESAAQFSPDGQCAVVI